MYNHQDSKKNSPRPRLSIDWKECKKGLLKPGWRFIRPHPKYLKLMMQVSQKHQIDLLQGEWTQLTTHVDHLEAQL
jgi:hypothetical protein